MLKTGSVPGQVMSEALNGDIITVLNDGIIAEYEDVLNRPKLRFNKRAVRVFMNEIKKRAVYTNAGVIDEEIPDLRNVVFYAVLMEKRKDEER